MKPEARGLFLEHCEFALGELLTAYFKARSECKQRPLFQEGSLCLVNDEIDYITIKSFRVLERPIAGALWNAMRLIGEDLYAEAGDTSLMRKMIEALEDKAGEGAVFRPLVLDKVWDGVGDWIA
jgi:hypothetical protein